jgi:hypothetical protein
MRLRTCLGTLLLALSACTQLGNAIPGAVRIDVDGTSVEFKKKPGAEAPAPAPAPAPPPPSQPAPSPAPDAPQR